MNVKSNRRFLPHLFEKYSKAGVISFGLFVIIIVSHISFIFISSMIYPSNEALPEGSIGQVLFIFLIFGSVFISLVGVGFGIAGSIKVGNKKSFSFFGIILNLIIFIILISYILA